MIGRYGFASTDDAPIPYRQRIREYYQALGYGAPYEWAHYAAVPFHPLNRPLSESRIALITTAAHYQPGKGHQGPGAPYNAKAKFYIVYSGDTAKDHDLRISHVAIDRSTRRPRISPPISADRAASECGLRPHPPRWLRASMAPRPIAHRVTLEVDGLRSSPTARLTAPMPRS